MTSDCPVRCGSSFPEGERSIVDGPTGSRKVGLRCHRHSLLFVRSPQINLRQPHSLGDRAHLLAHLEHAGRRFLGSMLRHARISSLSAAGMRGFTLMGE